MGILIAIPILIILVILQSALVSLVPLLHGTADIVLIAIIAWAIQDRVTTAWYWSAIGGLLISITSAMPVGVALVGYFLATGAALLVRRWVWQVPLLAMLIATIIGTLITQGIAIFILNFVGTPIPWVEAWNIITLPSMLLNLALAIPIYALITDLANWVYPEEIEI
jgi:hypothetical protein